MTETVYSADNMKFLLYYIVIPLVLILIIFFIGTKIYEHHNRNKDSNRTNFVINYWSNTLGIIITAILLSVSIGFSLAFRENLKILDVVDENIFLYYFFTLFPILSLLFLVFFVSKFIINIQKKEEFESKESEGEE